MTLRTIGQGLIIVVDVRLGAFDVVADVIGGVLVLIASLRVQGALRGADAMRGSLVGLAVIALPVTVLETLQPASGVIGMLAISQVLGAIVLARLLADALRRDEPGLAATWNSTFQLVAFLGLLPFVLGVALGAVASGATNVTIESPVVLILLLVLCIPVVALLRALWRTSRDPLLSPTPAT